MADRVAFQVEDFRTGDLGSGYDVALVFGVLNGEPADLRPRMIEKAFDALAPGGTIVLRDAVLTPDRTGPPDATIFALQMLLATDSGGLDTSEDWERWLTYAGFVDVAGLEVAGVGWSTFMLARRPR